ncbi:MAG: helix-turn-helix transcriptional regulator [Firmicutes bacterium]|nr:helix-turn-helix transcriptional regulator [Bacillota bacterium]
MNQDKSGKFIAKLRKEKNMTQEQLAEKMGVSINAVSKWERGLSFPDISLYKKLCNELDINIEELINGEKDSSDNAKEKAIISTVKEKEKIKNNYKKILILFIITFIIIFSILIYYNKNLKVNLVDDSDYLYDEVIDFIKEKEFSENPDASYNDFNVFYSYHGFGIEKNNNYKYVYMWIYQQSYYIESEDYGSGLAISSGSSIPIKVVFKDNKLQHIIYPKDGSEYISSIKEMFPGIIEYQVLNFDNEKNINKLFNEVQQKKNIYYDYLNLDMSKITMDDLEYNNLIFSIEYKKGICDIPVLLNVYKNNKYSLLTEYKSCKQGVVCNLMLQYMNPIEGEYNYNVIEIIRHSVDANLYQYTNDNLPEYMIISGKGHSFITDSDNKYLKELLQSINVDLTKCAKPNY